MVKVDIFFYFLLCTSNLILFSSHLLGSIIYSFIIFIIIIINLLFIKFLLIIFKYYLLSLFKNLLYYCIKFNNRNK